MPACYAEPIRFAQGKLHEESYMRGTRSFVALKTTQGDRFVFPRLLYCMCMVLESMFALSSPRYVIEHLFERQRTMRTSGHYL
jgi:hypothetical protein